MTFWKKFLRVIVVIVVVIEDSLSPFCLSNGDLSELGIDNQFEIQERIESTFNDNDIHNDGGDGELPEGEGEESMEIPTEENTEEPLQEQEETEELLDNIEEQPSSESSEQSQEENQEDQVTSQEQEEMPQENSEQNQENNQEDNNKEENQETTHEETNNPENSENSESKEESESTTTTEEETEISGDNPENNPENNSESISENTEPEITAEKGNSENSTTENGEQQENKEESENTEPLDPQENTLPEENQDVEPTEEQTEEINEEQPEKQIEEQSEEPTIRSILNQEPIIGSKKFRQVRVDVRADENTFPSGTYLKITPVYTEDLAQIQEEFTDTEIVAFDIQFLFDLEDETIELQPYTGKTVQVSFDYTQKEEFKNLNENEELQVYHIKDEEKIIEGEKIAEIAPLNTEETEQKADTLVIDAEHFSIYAIIKTNVPNDVLVHYDSGLGTFSDATTKIDVLYHATNGVYLADKTTSLPNQTGMMFQGRYTDDTCTTRRNGVTEDTKETERSVIACYLPFEEKTISLSGIELTLMDRNLGAKSPDDGGYRYQWGNNYGFEEGKNGFTPAIATQMITATPSEESTRSREKPYYSSNFISRENEPYRRDAEDNLTLWGEDTDQDLQKQGPCPVGYHIPNEKERNAVYLAYFKQKKTMKGFAELLGLPLGGYRNRVAATITSVGDVGWYWSSKAVTGSDAYAFTLTDDNGNPQDLKSRAYANNIRCFKNNDQNLTLSFETNGGTAVEPQIFKRYEARNQTFKPLSTKDGKSVAGRYKDADLTDEFVRSDSSFLDQDTTLYAKWGCKPGYMLDSNNQCVLRKVVVKYKVPNKTVNSISSYKDYKTITYTRNLSGQYIGNVVNLGFPNQAGYFFDNWYLDGDFTQVWLYPYDSDGLGESVTVYAHFLPFTDKVVSFGDVSFTIMDRNLGAKTRSNGGTDATEDNIGYFYQFGNRYGFANTGDLVNTSSYLTPKFATSYANGTFVMTNGKYSVGNYNNIWGDINNADSNFQGPCPSGYHVPMGTELNWYYKQFTGWKATDEGTEYCGVLGTGECFAQLLGLPFGGMRSYNGTLTGIGTISYLWTSQGADSYTKGYFQKITSSERTLPNTTRTNAFNVRCFKDTKNAVVTYNSMGGFGNHGVRYRVWRPCSSWWTPSRVGSIFEGYYLETSYDTLFTGNVITNVTNNLTKNVTVYAKYTCKDGYTMGENGKCYSLADNHILITFIANTGGKVDAHFPDGSLSKTLEYTSTTGFYYITPEEIQLPELTGYSFYGRYTGENLKTKWNGLSTSTTYKEITLYAKYVPFNDKVLNYGDISVVIMDRNLGATSPTAGGFFYQWGNNNGFSSSNNATSYAFIKTGTKERGPGNYVFNTSFIRRNPRTLTNYPNMRGGNGETATIANPDTDKQGPCPKGYHIPSIYEWKSLYQLFLAWTKTEEGSNYCNTQAPNNLAKCLTTFLGLSISGYRDTQWWNPGNGRTYYQSSTPNRSKTGEAHNFYVDTLLNSVNSGNSNSRSIALQVRCFKDSPDLTITYNTNGGSEISSLKNFKRWMPQQNLIIPQRAHSQFVGWFTDPELTHGLSRTGEKYFSENLTLYAKWECDDGYQMSMDKKSCIAATVVNFDAIANDGEVNRPIAGYDEGSTVDLSNFEVTKPGRTFVGWSTSQNGREPLENFEIGDTNMRLYAIFKKDLTATFQKNGNKNLTLNGEINENFTQTCTIWNDETSCTVPIPSIVPAEGFSTLGRSTGAEDHTVLYDHQTELTLTEDISLYAQTKKEAIDRKITFYPNGNAGFIYQGTTGTLATSYKVCTISEVYNGASQASSCSAEIIFPNILVNGEKTIIGWTESQNSLQNPINPKEKVELQFKSDLSFYAQSKSDGKNFTVTFYGNGSTIEGETSIQRTCTIAEVLNGGEQSTECEVTIPTPTRKDFSILGRNTNSTATTAEIPLNQTKLSVSGDKVFYAISKKEITSTFTRNGNDAQQQKGKTQTKENIIETCTIRNSAESCSIFTPTIISEKTPHILGYSLSSDAHIPSVSQNASLLVSKNQTYYAQSQKDEQPLTISFYLNNNANFIYQGQKVTSGKGTYPLCTRETVYNGATQPKCSAAITFPKITAPTATPKVLGRSTDNTEYDIAYQSEETKTLSSTGNLSFFAQTMIDAKTFEGSFEKGVGITSISTDVQTCTISATYNGITQKTSCNVSAPTFTVTTGYENPIWQSVQDSAIFWNANEKDTFSLSENASYSITASPRTDIPYKVEHYQENANDTGYTLKETETLYGTTNEMTNARFKAYNGFLGVEFLQEKISAEEQTVIQIKYQRSTYKLSFDTNGGTTLNTIDYKYGATVNAPANNPTRTGYTFKNRDQSFPFTMTNANRTVTASWNANTYIIAYDLQSGTYGTNHPTSATYDQEFTVDHPTRTGYTFAGWEITGKSGTIKETTFKNLTATSGATVNFVATRTPNTDTNYTVNHHKEKLEGGYEIETENMTGTTDTQTNAEIKTYEGFSLSGTVSQANIEPDGSTVIDIYYKRNEYTISFDSDGGTSIPEITAKYAAPLTQPADPTKVGYYFDGWDAPFPSTMPGKEIALKAKRKEHKIHITLDKDGGTGGTDELWYLYEIPTFYADVNLQHQLSEIARPTKDGYDFQDYFSEEKQERYLSYPDNSGNIIEFADDLHLDIDQNATLKARWTPKIIHVTLDQNGGTGGTLDFYFSFNEKKYYTDEELEHLISKIVKPTREGYTFQDYYSEEMGERFVTYQNGEQRIELDTPEEDSYSKISHDLTLKARRKENEKPQPTHSGGGGSSGGLRLQKDDCPDGDFSDSYYDKKCFNDPKEEKSEQTHGSAEYSQEEIDIYEWAKEMGLTSMETIESFAGRRSLTRAEMAKIVSIYLTDILEKKVNHQKQCTLFSDIKDITSDLHEYIIESCDLGIMGRTSDGQNAMEIFWPHDEVTKAEGATIISRIFWKHQYKNKKGQERYEGHLNHLIEIGAIEDSKNVKAPFSRKDFYGTLKKIYTLDV